MKFKVGDIVNIKIEHSGKIWYHNNYMIITDIWNDNGYGCAIVDYDFGNLGGHEILLKYLDNKTKLRKLKLKSL